MNELHDGDFGQGGGGSNERRFTLHVLYASCRLHTVHRTRAGRYLISHISDCVLHPGAVSASVSRWERKG